MNQPPIPPQQPPQHPQQPPYGHGQPPQGPPPGYGQQPPYGYAQPQYQQPPQQVYVANQPTRTVHGVGCLGKLFHGFMMLITLGLWYPVYSRAKRTSRHY